jgi:hypothetical protein
MFENSEIQIMRRGPSFWLSAALCAIAVLFVVNLVRVNRRPLQDHEAAGTFVEQHFEGKIANERSVIEAGETLPYRVHFNYRSSIKGSFRAANNDQRILFVILDEKNYQSWASGGEFKSAVSTGKVPAGEVSRILDAGTYFLIFDNRGADKRAVLDIDLRAE